MTHQEMWAAYRAAHPAVGEDYEAWAYGGKPDELAELTCTGIKTATASAGPLYALEGEPLPQAGDHSVILDSRDQAVCVICTTRVYTVPFDQVSAEHAYQEGEGDRSLAYWRRVHEDFFRAELAEAGLVFTSDMPVVCEEFELVWPLGSNIEGIIHILTHLCDWVGPNEYLNQAIEQLRRYDQLTVEERGTLKHLLSREMLFHIRWLGDALPPGFVGDGSSFAWWNYLSDIAEICQVTL